MAEPKVSMCRAANLTVSYASEVYLPEGLPTETFSKEFCETGAPTEVTKKLADLISGFCANKDPETLKKQAGREIAETKCAVSNEYPKVAVATWTRAQTFSR